MTKRCTRGSDGMYKVKGKKFQECIGSRASVWHGTAYKTRGNLCKAHLMKNKWGRIVSRKKHKTAKKENRLVKHGFLAKKGKFGVVKVDSTHSRTHKRRKNRTSKKKSYANLTHLRR